MPFDISKTWCRAAAAREDGLDIGAGPVAADPIFTPAGGLDKSPEASDTGENETPALCPGNHPTI